MPATTLGRQYTAGATRRYRFTLGSLALALLLWLSAGVLDMFLLNVSYVLVPDCASERVHRSAMTVLLLLLGWHADSALHRARRLRLENLALGIDRDEHRQLTAALRAGAERYRGLVAAALDGIVLMTTDGRIVLVNEAFAAMVGCGVQELQGRTIMELDVRGEAAMLSRAEIVRRALLGEQVTYEAHYRHRDGRTVTLLVTALTVTLQEQTYFMATHRDISAQKRIYDDLRGELHGSRQVIDGIGAGILVTDRDGRCRLWNRTMTELTGLDEPAVRGRRLEELFPFLAESALAERLRQTLAGKPPAPAEYPYPPLLTRREGWCRESHRLVHGTDGAPDGVLTVLQDSTAAHCAEVLLQEQRRFAEALFNGLPGPAMVLDRDGCILQGNERLAELTGRRRGELAGMRPDELFAADERERVAAAIRAAAAGGRTSLPAHLVNGRGGQSAHLFAWQKLAADGRELLAGAGIDSSDPPPAAPAPARAAEEPPQLPAETADLRYDRALPARRPVPGAPGAPGADPAWQALIHPDDRERVDAQWRDTLAAAGRHWRAVYRYRSTGGAYRLVLDCGTIEYRNGTAARVAGLLTRLPAPAVLPETPAAAPADAAAAVRRVSVISFNARLLQEGVARADEDHKRLGMIRHHLRRLPGGAEEQRAEKAPALPAAERHILFADDDAAERERFTAQAGALGYRVTACAEGAAVLAACRAAPHGFTAVILDNLLPDLTGGVLACRLRAAGIRVPVILATGQTLDMLPEATLDAIDGFLQKPYNRAEITQLLVSIGALV